MLLGRKREVAFANNPRDLVVDVVTINGFAGAVSKKHPDLVE